MKVSNRVGAKKSKSSAFDSENIPVYVNGQENVPNLVNSTKLLITNLNNDVTDSDICELFSEFGSIREVAVHYNCFGYSLGTAHVVYLEHRDAAEAARRYNGVTLDGEPMTITLEGSPNGSLLKPAVPVKMRLSYGPNHTASEFRNPLSQLNRGKTPKRLASGPKGVAFGQTRGRGRPRGRPAVLSRGKPVGRIPTAEELDMELEEYLSQTKKFDNEVNSVDAMDIGDDDFGEVMKVPLVAKTPKTPKLVKPKKKTPSRTPGKKTPTTTPGKTPSRTPGRTPKTSGKTPSRTPGKTTPSTTPGKTTKSTTPGKTTSKSKTPGKTPTRTPGKISSETIEKTETPVKETSQTPEKTSVETPAKTPKTKTAMKKSSLTPAKKSNLTPAKKSTLTPAKTPGKTPVRGKKTKSRDSTDEPTTPKIAIEESDMDVVTDLDKTSAAVPKSVKKLNPRRSGRFSRI